MMAQDDILIPEDAMERMLKEIPTARLMDLEGTNHYTIMFQPN